MITTYLQIATLEASSFILAAGAPAPPSVDDKGYILEQTALGTTLQIVFAALGVLVVVAGLVAAAKAAGQSRTDGVVKVLVVTAIVASFMFNLHWIVEVINLFGALVGKAIDAFGQLVQ